MSHITPPIDIHGSDHISLDDMRVIANAIHEENEEHPHMLESSPEELFACVKKHGWMVARTFDGDLAGFIKLSLLDQDMQIYERGSLLVLPNHRRCGIWWSLIHAITERYSARSILAITNVPAVIHFSSHHPLQQELPKSSTPHHLLMAIEWPQPLLANDRIFINHTLAERIENGEF